MSSDEPRYVKPYYSPYVRTYTASISVDKSSQVLHRSSKSEQVNVRQSSGALPSRTASAASATSDTALDRFHLSSPGSLPRPSASRPLSALSGRTLSSSARNSRSDAAYVLQQLPEAPERGRAHAQSDDDGGSARDEEAGGRRAWGSAGSESVGVQAGRRVSPRRSSSSSRRRWTSIETLAAELREALAHVDRLAQSSSSNTPRRGSRPEASVAPLEARFAKLEADVAAVRGQAATAEAALHELRQRHAPLVPPAQPSPRTQPRSDEGRRETLDGAASDVRGELAKQSGQVLALVQAMEEVRRTQTGLGQQISAVRADLAARQAADAGALQEVWKAVEALSARDDVLDLQIKAAMALREQAAPASVQTQLLKLQLRCVDLQAQLDVAKSENLRLPSVPRPSNSAEPPAASKPRGRTARRATKPKGEPGEPAADAAEASDAPRHAAAKSRKASSKPRAAPAAVYLVGADPEAAGSSGQVVAPAEREASAEDNRDSQPRVHTPPKSGESPQAAPAHAPAAVGEDAEAAAERTPPSKDGASVARAVCSDGDTPCPQGSGTSILGASETAPVTDTGALCPIAVCDVPAECDRANPSDEADALASTIQTHPHDGSATGDAFDVSTTTAACCAGAAACGVLAAGLALEAEGCHDGVAEDAADDEPTEPRQGASVQGAQLVCPPELQQVDAPVSDAAPATAVTPAATGSAPHTNETPVTATTAVTPEEGRAEAASPSAPHAVVHPDQHVAIPGTESVGVEPGASQLCVDTAPDDAPAAPDRCAEPVLECVWTALEARTPRLEGAKPAASVEPRGTYESDAIWSALSRNLGVEQPLAAAPERSSAAPQQSSAAAANSGSQDGGAAAEAAAQGEEEGAADAARASSNVRPSTAVSHRASQTDPAPQAAGDAAAPAAAAPADGAPEDSASDAAERGTEGSVQRGTEGSVQRGTDGSVQRGTDSQLQTAAQADEAGSDEEGSDAQTAGESCGADADADAAEGCCAAEADDEQPERLSGSQAPCEHDREELCTWATLRPNAKSEASAERAVRASETDVACADDVPEGEGVSLGDEATLDDGVAADCAPGGGDGDLQPPPKELAPEDSGSDGCEQPHGDSGAPTDAQVDAPAAPRPHSERGPPDADAREGGEPCRLSSGSNMFGFALMSPESGNGGTRSLHGPSAAGDARTLQFADQRASTEKAQLAQDLMAEMIAASGPPEGSPRPLVPTASKARRAFGSETSFRAQSGTGGGEDDADLVQSAAGEDAPADAVEDTGPPVATQLPPLPLLPVTGVRGLKPGMLVERSTGLLFRHTDSWSPYPTFVGRLDAAGGGGFEAKGRKPAILERFTTTLQRYQSAYRLSAAAVFSQSCDREGEDRLSRQQMRILVRHMVPDATLPELEFVIRVAFFHVDGDLCCAEFHDLLDLLGKALKTTSQRLTAAPFNVRKLLGYAWHLHQNDESGWATIVCSRVVNGVLPLSGILDVLADMALACHVQGPVTGSVTIIAATLLLHYKVSGGPGLQLQELVHALVVLHGDLQSDVVQATPAAAEVDDA